MYSLDFIRKATNMPDSILSSAFVRSVSGPTRNHTRSLNTDQPMLCPRLCHRSNGTFPSYPDSASLWRAQMSRQWSYRFCPHCISYCCGSLTAYGHMCRSQHVHPLCHLLNCMRVRCSLTPNGECTDNSCPPILRDKHWCGICAQLTIVNAHECK